MQPSSYLPASSPSLAVAMYVSLSIVITAIESGSRKEYSPGTVGIVAQPSSSMMSIGFSSQDFSP